MRVARFTFNVPTTYEGVPIPDNITEESDIFNYIIEHIQDFDKYKTGNEEVWGVDPIDVITIEDDDGNEYEITNNDF